MGRAKILVVDDDSGFLRFVTEILIGAGYDVRGSDDPFSATSLAQAFRPDLAILDIAMPGKDGIELAKELRRESRTFGIPVMFVSARKATEGAQEIKDTGAVAYLEKPVPSSKLLWTVKTLLEAGGEKK